MGSFVWERDLQDAMDEPYEYPAQEQFLREAKKLIGLLKKKFSEKESFLISDHSSEKAIWMLQVDALEALDDALDLLNDKKPRIAYRLFRDVFETLDISKYFFLANKEAENDLKKWFKDGIILHGKYRKLIENLGYDPKKENYRILSKYSHRSYHTITMNYVRSPEGRMIYQHFPQKDSKPLVHFVSTGYCLLGKLIKYFLESVKTTDSINDEEAKYFWEESMEKGNAPRRFGPNTIRITMPLKAYTKEEIENNNFEK